LGLPVGARRSRGFNLVEMLIAMAIGMVVIVALLGMLANSWTGAATNRRTSEIEFDGRYALTTLQHDLLGARFRGNSWAEPTAATTVITPITGECLPAGAAAGSFVSNLRQGIWGSNDSNPFPDAGNCIPTASYLRGDVLVIRKVDSIPVTSLTANTLYLRSTYNAAEIFRGIPATACATPISSYAAPFNIVPCITGTPRSGLDDFRLQVFVYFIGPSTDDATLPALYRSTLQTDGTMTSDLIANGIEHLQVQYGRATTDLNTRYYNASGITGSSVDTAVTEWDDVDSVRVWILARTATAEPGYTNTNTYSMGDVNYTVNDGFRRNVRSAVIHVRN
jgi:type IV pilus assembly protein PilW